MIRHAFACGSMFAGITFCQTETWSCLPCLAGKSVAKSHQVSQTREERQTLARTVVSEKNPQNILSDGHEVFLERHARKCCNVDNVENVMVA